MSPYGRSPVILTVIKLLSRKKNFNQVWITTMTWCLGPKKERSNGTTRLQLDAEKKGKNCWWSSKKPSTELMRGKYSE